jgi:hypothetical protein
MIGFPGKPSQPHGRMKNSCRLTVGHTNTNRQWQYKMQDVAVLSSKHVFEMIFYATTLGLSASSASVGPYTGPHSDYWQWDGRMARMGSPWAPGSAPPS